MYKSAEGSPAVRDLNDVESTLRAAALIRAKPILRSCYEEFYSFFVQGITGVPLGTKLEIGSGGGFLREVIPDVITSEIVPMPGVDLVCSAEALPFQDSSVAAIFMTNVLHHVTHPDKFFREVVRCLRPGARCLLIEPANTYLSSILLRTFHNEPFDPRQREWELSGQGRMTSANNALPWIIFDRDRSIFMRRYPELDLSPLMPFMPLKYLMSGGVNTPRQAPFRLLPFITFLEQIIAPLNPILGLFYKISLVKKS